MTKKTTAARKSTSARKPRGRVRRSARAALSIATNARRDVEKRIAALAEVPLAASEIEDRVSAVLKLLRDEDELVDVRLAALHTLQAATFSPPTESWRGDYLAALRQVAEDEDAELREQALGILALEKDGFAQKKLLDGLQHPEKALIEPEKALQLLSYDVHAEAYPVARRIVKHPPNPTAKREALRLLAADAGAAPIFEKVLRDKREPPELRQISAAALQALKPEKVQAYARKVLLDPGEQEEMQATSLTALTQFGKADRVSKDKALLQRVDRLSGVRSPMLKQSARQFLKKYKPAP
ncbi:MAG: hypothetical protein P0119_08055 [Nitrospira sp.]|nr:hypothetical protein [Nitrospira sp.]